MRRFPQAKTLPDPDLIIGAGHKTHFSLLCAKHARGGKTIVLMKPSVPTSWFDYCLIPYHDNPPDTSHILATQGALNRVIPSNNHDPASGLILIGGSSNHYHWNDDQLIGQVTTVLATPGISWKITDSPRTPAKTRGLLAMLDKNRVSYHPHEETAPDWLVSQLQKAGVVWVSEDSISMVYEALSSGAAVGLFHVPVKRNSRITRAIKQLLNNQQVTSHKQWLSGQALSPMDPPLYESKRCAIEIMRYFYGYSS